MSRRPFERPVPRTAWYLRHPRYRSYLLREATCLLVAVYCALLLAALWALSSGDPEPWRRFLASQQRPGWIVFHAIALGAFWTWQSAPWFRLAPKAMPLSRQRFPSAPRLIVASHYLAWLAISAVVLWLTGVI